jgi:hypothetical protein
MFKEVNHPIVNLLEDLASSPSAPLPGTRIFLRGLRSDASRTRTSAHERAAVGQGVLRALADTR